MNVKPGSNGAARYVPAGSAHGSNSFAHSLSARAAADALALALGEEVEDAADGATLDDAAAADTSGLTPVLAGGEDEEPPHDAARDAAATTRPTIRTRLEPSPLNGRLPPEIV